jgi:hypothetical protein
MENIITLAIREIGKTSNNGETVEPRFEIRDCWTNQGGFYLIVAGHEADGNKIDDTWAGKMAKLP